MQVPSRLLQREPQEDGADLGREGNEEPDQVAAFLGGSQSPEKKNHVLKHPKHSQVADGRDPQSGTAAAAEPRAAHELHRQRRHVRPPAQNLLRQLKQQARLLTSALIEQARPVAEERRPLRVKGPRALPAGGPQHAANVPTGQTGSRRPQRVQHVVRTAEPRRLRVAI